MLRFISAILAAAVFFLLTIVNWPIKKIIQIFNKEKSDIYALRCVQTIFRIILFISGTKIEVIGKENVIKDRAALYTLNHYGMFDVLITYIHMIRPTAFVSKAEIKKVPFLNFWMKQLYCLFLDRDDPRSSMKMLLDAVENIKKGVSVCICPEGTRNKTKENTLEFKAGSFKIATKVNAPIVPVAIYNTNAIFEDQFPSIKPVKVYIEFLKPIDTSKLGLEEKKSIHETVQKMISDRIQYVKDSKFIDGGK